MKSNHALCGLLIGILVICCKPALKISCEYDKTVDFSRYKTFTVRGGQSLEKAFTRANQDRVMNATRNEMTKKGFTEVTGSPDLMVDVNAIIDNKATVSNTSYYEYGSVYRPYTWGPGVSYTDYDARNYKDGSVIIDVLDAGTSKQLWQGIGIKEMDAPSKHPEKEISKVVGSVMAAFPPATK